MKYYLSVFVNGEKKQTILLNSLPNFRSGRMTVGRADTNDIVLPYPSVSRNHAVLEFVGSNFEIVDAGSLNKLRVNGTAYERIRLGNGTKVTIGTSTNSVVLCLNYIDDISDAPAKKEPERKINKQPVKISAGKTVGDKVGGGARFVAAVMDATICMFMGIGAAVILLFLFSIINSIAIVGILTFLAVMAVIWIYFAFSESGESRATMGKIALGMCVVDANTGETVTFKQATKRYFAKMLSILILFIGFFPIFGKKQTFHDYIAKTQVIKNPRVKQ